MTTVFISYSRRNRDFAIRLAKDLTSARLRVWVDFKDIPTGAAWDQAIQRGLDTSDLMILIISPESMISANVSDEWQYFRDQDKPIIPVLLQFAEVPFQLRRLQYVDFTDQNAYDQSLKKLLQVIGAEDFRVTPEEARVQQRRIDDALESARQDQGQLIAPSEPKPAPNGAALLAEARIHHRKKVINKAVTGYTQVLLDRGDPVLRIQAAQALGELRAAPNDLMQSLQDDPDPSVRRAVVRTLAGFQSPSIDDALQVAAVVDPDLEVRLYAALISVYFKLPNRAASWLDSLTSSPHPQLRSVIGEAQLFANDLVKLSGHVFVSYSRQDAERFTLELVDTLRSQHRFRVWVDTNLTPGTESWKKAIAKAIEQCSLLVLVLSPSVHGSKWIGEEVSYAEQLSKERLYVKYQNTHMPFGMAEMQGLREDLTFEDYPDEMLSALVAELTRRNIPRIPEP